MRIAVYSDNFYPEISGIAESIMTIGVELARRGHEINFFAPRFSEADFARVKLPNKEVDLGRNINITRFGSIPFNIGGQRGRVVIPFGRLTPIRRFNPDIIHAHLPFGTGLEGLIAAKKLKVPFVGTNHTPPAFTEKHAPLGLRWLAGFQKNYDSWFYNHCDFVSSPASGIFSEMKDFNSKIFHRAVSNPLKTDFFVPLDDSVSLKQKFGFSDFTLLFIGRLGAEKNVDQLILAAHELKNQIPDLSIGIASKGPEENNLRALAKKLGLENNVKFLGFMDEQRLLEAYNASDVFVMPSTVETQSLSSMEAMLCGIPVVAVHSLGLDEYLKPEAGFLVPPGNPSALAEKILYLYNNPHERLQMGKAARRSVLHLGRKEIAEEWEKIYTETINNFKR